MAWTAKAWREDYGDGIQFLFRRWGGDMDNQKVVQEYVSGLYERFPDIRAYDVDDWDWTWADEGYQFLEACDFGMAELTFQRLIAARPRHPDGYEGLALVYQAIGLRVWAVLLIDEAVRLARKQLAEDVLDADVLDEILEEQGRIHAMPVEAEEAKDVESLLFPGRNGEGV